MKQVPAEEQTLPQGKYVILDDFFNFHLPPPGPPVSQRFLTSATFVLGLCIFRNSPAFLYKVSSVNETSHFVTNIVGVPNSRRYISYAESHYTQLTS